MLRLCTQTISLILLLTAAIAMADTSTSAPAGRNVVLIIGDDHGLQLGCYGDTVIKTPSLDRLAAEGTRFANAFAAVSSCSPSRSVMFTGQFTLGETSSAAVRYFRAEVR